MQRESVRIHHATASVTTVIPSTPTEEKTFVRVRAPIQRPFTERTRGYSLQAQNVPRPAPQALALPAGEEAAIIRRMQVLVLKGGMAKLQVLLQKLLASPLLPPQAIEQVRGWKVTFLRLNPENRQAKADMLAILVLQIIRPIWLYAAENSPEREQGLTWELEVEAILKQLFPRLDFRSFINACDHLLREERVLRNQCEQANRADAICREVGSAAIAQTHALIERTFSALRQRLIEVHQAHQADGREQAIESQSQRIENLIQQLMTQAASISELGHSLNAQEARLQQTLLKCKNLLERSL